MEYWHEIIRNYDDPKHNGARSKDHGTFSQKTAVILLVYLSLGTDYSAGIAKYFYELLKKESEDICIPRILTQSNKMSSVLKRMSEDELIILLKKVKAGAAPRSYYVLNPRILQSPIRDPITYIKRDGSPFTIPSEIVEGFLGWQSLEQAGTIVTIQEEKLRQERHFKADRLFRQISSSEKADYVCFLDHIRECAFIWDAMRIQSSKPRLALDRLISDYILEICKPPLGSDDGHLSTRLIYANKDQWERLWEKSNCK